VDNGRVRVENLSQRDSIILVIDSVIAVGANPEMDPLICSMLGETPRKWRVSPRSLRLPANHRFPGSLYDLSEQARQKS
jgi:hypothetical protein